MTPEGSPSADWRARCDAEQARLDACCLGVRVLALVAWLEPLRDGEGADGELAPGLRQELGDLARAVGNAAREVVDDAGVDVSGLPGVAVAARLTRYGFGDPVEWLRLGYALGVSVGCEAVESGGSGDALVTAEGPEAAGAVHVAEPAPGPSRTVDLVPWCRRYGVAVSAPPPRLHHGSDLAPRGVQDDVRVAD